MSASTHQPQPIQLRKAPLSMLVPVMASFFVMGFVDLVGTATNFAKTDFGLSDTLSNTFTTMVFFWFLILSIPAGLLMNHIGRRKTVLLSIAITALACLLPVIGYMTSLRTLQLTMIIISFCLLGIGNVFMQVSLNPLVGNLAHDKKLAGTLTFGQFVKAIASFIAPLIASWAANAFGKWWLLYPIYLVIAIVVFVLLAFDRIHENPPDEGRTSIPRCLSLLSDSVILLCFIGIVCHVGIDVGINTTAPRILSESTNMALESAAVATSVYFAFRTIGCLAGSVLLQRLSLKTMLRLCSVLLTAGCACLIVFCSIPHLPVWLAMAGIGLLGLGDCNVFSIMLTTALLHRPQRQNEISGLMMMGLIGGAIFPPLMGLASDGLGMQLGAVLVLTLGAAFIVLMSVFFKQYRVKE